MLACGTDTESYIDENDYQGNGWKMSETIFSKKVQEYIINEMSICIDNLTNKILNYVPNSSWFFNNLFEYMMDLKTICTYDYNDISTLNNKKFRNH